jgi:hypothetical protein
MHYTQAHSTDHSTRTRVEVATARLMLQHSAYSPTAHMCEDTAGAAHTRASASTMLHADEVLLGKLVAASEGSVRQTRPGFLCVCVCGLKQYSGKT